MVANLSVSLDPNQRLSARRNRGRAYPGELDEDLPLGHRLAPVAQLRRRLGQELIRLRKSSGMNGEQVAAMMEWSSPSKLYKIKGGRQGIQPKELRELLGYYGITDTETVDALVFLAREGKQRAWWSRYAEAIHDSYGTYVGLESAAAELRTYESGIVPGLPQTEAYARALLTTGAQGPEPALSPDTLDGKLQVRIQRQAALDRLRLWVILDEAALRRVVGSRKVMAAQYGRLMEAAKLPTVKLQRVADPDRAGGGGAGLTPPGDRDVRTRRHLAQVHPQQHQRRLCGGPVRRPDRPGPRQQGPAGTGAHLHPRRLVRPSSPPSAPPPEPPPASG